MDKLSCSKLQILSFVSALILAFANSAWPADIIDLDNYPVPLSEKSCQRILSGNGSSMGDASITNLRNFRAARARMNPTLNDEISSLGRDIGSVAYPDLRIKYVKPSPLDPSATGTLVFGNSSDPNAGVDGAKPVIPLTFFPADSKVALTHDRSLIIIGLQRLPLPTEMDVLSRSSKNLISKTPDAPNIMDHQAAAARVTVKSVNVYDARSGIPIAQFPLPSFALRILFVQTIPNVKSPGQDLVAAATSGPGGRDEISIFSLRLKRNIGWLRVSGSSRGIRLLGEASVSPDGNDIILSYVKDGRKFYFRQSLEGVFRNEANPDFAIPAGDPNSKYRNPTPVDMWPTDDFNFRSKGLIHASFVGKEIFSVDRSGDVRLHSSKWDNIGRLLFKIKADENSQIAVSGDGRLIVSASRTAKPRPSDEINVYDSGVLQSSLALPPEIPEAARLVGLQVIHGAFNVVNAGQSRTFGSKVQATYETEFLENGVAVKRFTTVLWADKGSGLTLVRSWDSTMQFTPIL